MNQPAPQVANRIAEFNNAYWLNPYDYAHHSRIDELVDYLMSEITFNGQKNLIKMNLRFLLTELELTSRNDPKRYFAYPRGRDEWTAYNQQGNPNKISYKLVEILDELTKHGLVENWIGFRDDISRLARARATEKLNESFTRYNLHHQPVTQHPDMPLVKITNDKTKSLLPIRRAWKSAVNQSEALLEQYNALIENSDIDHTNPNLQQTLHHITTWRGFTNDTDHGGRFFGGWWQQLSQSNRLEILIDGERVVELDYQCQALHLLYGMYVGKSFQAIHDNPNPPRDGYKVGRHLRDLIKRMFICLLGASNLKSAYQGLRGELFRDYLKAEQNIEAGIEGAEEKAIMLDRMRTSILTYDNFYTIYKAFTLVHPLLENYLAQGIAIKLMNIDSFICSHIIEKMTDQGLPVLTIHDSFIVKHSHQDQLLKVMQEAYQQAYKGQSLSLSLGGIKKTEPGKKPIYL